MVLGALALALVLGSWVAYMATVPSGKVPRTPLAHLATQAAGALLAIAGFVGASRGGDGLLGPGLLGGVAVMMSGLFFFLYSQRGTPVGDIRVEVGDRLRPFSALTPEGERFESEAFAGRRILLKFFRGHW